MLLWNRGREHVLSNPPLKVVAPGALKAGGGVKRQARSGGGLQAAGGAVSVSVPKRRGPRRPTSGDGGGGGARVLSPRVRRVVGHDAVCQPAHRPDHGAHRRECQVHHREHGPGVRPLRERPAAVERGGLERGPGGDRVLELRSGGGVFALGIVGAGRRRRCCGAFTPIGFHPSGWPTPFGGSSSPRCP